MKAKNVAQISDCDLSGAKVQIGDNITKLTRGPRQPTEYQPGDIGANPQKRNYIKYLVERYHRYRDADRSFGRTTTYSYAVIYKNIESRFRASAYHIPEGKFEELVDYLQGRIASTIVGKKNRARGISNYKSFDEYVMEHMGPSASE